MKEKEQFTPKAVQLPLASLALSTSSDVRQAVQGAVRVQVQSQVV